MPWPAVRVDRVAACGLVHVDKSRGGVNAMRGITKKDVDFICGCLYLIAFCEVLSTVISVLRLVLWWG